MSSIIGGMVGVPAPSGNGLFGRVGVWTSGEYRARCTEQTELMRANCLYCFTFIGSEPSANYLTVYVSVLYVQNVGTFACLRFTIGFLTVFFFVFCPCMNKTNTLATRHATARGLLESQTLNFAHSLPFSSIIAQHITGQLLNFSYICVSKRTEV